MAEEADPQRRHLIFSEDARLALGLKLAELRKKTGRSQRQLSRETGISSSRLSRIERGCFLLSLEELGRLRAVLGFDVEEIVFGRSAASELSRLAGSLESVGDPGEVAVVGRLMEWLIEAKALRTPGGAER